MKILSLFLAVIICVPTLYAQSDTNCLWAKKVAGSTDEFLGSMVCDAEGSLYVCGSFTSPAISVGDDSTIAQSSQFSNTNIFLVKYSENGKVLWTRRALGSNHAVASAIAADKEGNIYVTGWFRMGSLQFRDSTRTVYGTDDIFIAKYDKDGDVLWARSVGGYSTFDKATGITTDQDGNVYICGNAEGGLKFEDGQTVPAGIFIAKFTNEGKKIWAKNVGKRNLFNEITTLTCDIKGNVYTAGYYRDDSLNVGDDFVLSGSSHEDGFLAKYTTEGLVEWGAQVGGNFPDHITDISTDSIGNIYIVGDYTSPELRFNNGIILKQKGVGEAFVAKYDMLGNTLWARAAGGKNDRYNYPTGILVGKTGDLYVSGYFNEVYITNPGNIDFGNSVILAGVGTDGFLAKYTKNGDIAWAKKVGGTGHNRILAMAGNANGDVYLSGTFNSSFNGQPFHPADTIDFGNNIRLSSDSLSLQDIFLVKYSDTPASVGSSTTLLKAYVKIHPNPAHATSHISFKTTAPSLARLTLTDVLGRQTLLKEETLDAGEHSTEINTADFPAGIYVLTLEAEGQVRSQTVVIER